MRDTYDFAQINRCITQYISIIMWYNLYKYVIFYYTVWKISLFRTQYVNIT